MNGQRTPMPPRTKPMRRGKPLRRVSLKRQADGWKRMRSGLRPFPKTVAALLDGRDEFCQRDGRPGPLHRHHRRRKGMGGDQRAHAQCACNGVKLCVPCHRWVHDNPEKARREGFIVSDAEACPADVGLIRFVAAGGDQKYWPACDGRWDAAAPEPEERAA